MNARKSDNQTFDDLVDYRHVRSFLSIILTFLTDLAVDFLDQHRRA
jgi:hypothetical protein